MGGELLGGFLLGEGQFDLDPRPAEDRLVGGNLVGGGLLVGVLLEKDHLIWTPGFLRRACGRRASERLPFGRSMI